MRILLVNEGNVERAGVCLFMYQWCQVLSETFPGNIVSIYFRGSINDKTLAHAFEDLKVRIITGNHSIEGTSKDKANRTAIRSDLRIILKNGIDIIHINSSVIGFTSIVLREARKAKVPVRICHSHGKFEESWAGKNLHDMLRAYIRKEATVYAGCSRAAGEYLFGRSGVKSTKWQLVPNSIDTKKYAFNEKSRQERRKELGLREDECLLGAVGYLEEVKNHSFLIDVVYALKKDGERVKLIILGEGSLRERLEEKIKDYGLKDDIILYGRTNDVSGWLSAMDIYIMPSLSEGLPLSAVEAQASGLPCLLSNRISEEVDILSSVYHLPIDQGADVWVEKIIDMEPCNRAYSAPSLKNESERFLSANKVLLAGFDSSSLAHEIREMYNLNARDIAEN